MRPRHRVSGRPHLGAGRADGGAERRDVVGAVVPLAVDEERRRAGDAAQVGRLDVLRDPGLVDVPAQLVVEPVDVEAELARRSGAGRRGAARPGGRAGGRASPRTRPARRPPRPPRRRAAPAGGRRSAAGAARRSGRRCRSSSSRTTGSAWPQYGHSKSPNSITVIGASTGPRMWSCSGSTSGTRSWITVMSPSSARAFAARREQRRQPVHRPGQRRRHDDGGQRAELGLVQLRTLERAGGDEQRDGEADPRDRAAAQHGGPPDGRPDPAAESRVTAHAVTTTPTGLPTT